jgi:hypothetical protein
MPTVLPFPPQPPAPPPTPPAPPAPDPPALNPDDPYATVVANATSGYPSPKPPDPTPDPYIDIVGGLK